MEASTIRRFTALHSWTGLVSGWVLFIAFFAGAITVFYHELHVWGDPALRRADAQPLSEVSELVDQMVRGYPQTANALQISLPRHGPALAFVPTLADGTATGDFEVRVLKGAELLPHDVRPSVLPDFIYQIHYSAGIPGDFGYYLLGFVCVIYGLAVVSGIVIHAPQLAKDLFALRYGANLKRFWQDAHNVIGILSLPFHAMYAYTGAMLCIFTLLAASVNYLALDGRASKDIDEAMLVAPIPERSGERASMVRADAILATAISAAPGFKPTFFTFHNHGDRNAVVDVYGDIQGGLVSTGRVLVSATTGDVIAVAVPGDAPLGLSTMGVIMGLHYGAFGGPLVKWMYFILGFAGAFLFYSGNLLWIESRRRRRSEQQPRVHYVMAQLTVGICLGASFGIAALFVANRIPIPSTISAAADKFLYYFIFLISVAYACFRPPARAAMHLLIASAITAGAIPLLNLATTGDHFLRSAQEGLWSVFAVDATALLVALLFLLLARLTHRRAYTGDPNSVWSLAAHT